VLLVVGPGLQVVENGTFGYASMLRVQLLRLGNDGREGNALLVFAQRIHTALDQINSALAQVCVDFFFEPGVRLIFGGFLGRM